MVRRNTDARDAGGPDLATPRYGQTERVGSRATDPSVAVDRDIDGADRSIDLPDRKVGLELGIIDRFAEGRRDGREVRPKRDGIVAGGLPGEREISGACCTSITQALR